MIIDKVVTISSAIIKNEKGEVLLLQRSGVTSYPDHWQLVEGKLDRDEKPDEALKREIKEEIGAGVGKMELTTPMYSEIEAKDQKYLGFRIIFNVETTSEDIKLSHEHKAFGWYSKDEALALPLLPGIREILQKLV